RAEGNNNPGHPSPAPKLSFQLNPRSPLQASHDYSRPLGGKAGVARLATVSELVVML
ncbi:hypothetical protein KXX22_006476, partial [Aspergillus fumigatus]